MIHSKTIIGDNVWISQNVTIGRKEGQTEVPTICDNVYIGPGSVIIGKITLGEGCVIGANSFVNKDVPSRMVVAGAPAKKIRMLSPDEVYRKS